MPRSANPVPQYFTAKNKILVGGLMFYFEAGSSTPKTTFADPAETIPNTHPVVLDSEGRLPNVFFTGTAKQVLKDSDNVQIWERDNVGDNDTPNFNDADLQFFSTTQNMIDTFSKTPVLNDIVETLGFDVEGDGGNGQWQFKGLTGQTPSQSPAQLGEALLNDANGNQWSLVTVVGTALPEYNPIDLGADPTGAVTSHLELQATIQAAINKGKASVDMTGGYYLLDSAVTNTVPGDIALSIIGSGRKTCGVIVNNSTGGIILTSGSRTSPIYISDIGFKARLQNSGTAFEYSVPTGGNQLQRIFEAKNIFMGAEIFAGFDTGFNKGLVAEGMYRPYISNVIVTQGSAATHIGVVGISVNGTFKHHITDCFITGFDIGITDEGGNGEGGYITETTANGARIGYSRQRDGREPECWVTNSHFNCTEVGIRLDGVKYAWISNCLLYAQGDAEADYHDIEVIDGEGININSNTYRQAGAPDRIHVYLNPISVNASPIVRDIFINDKAYQATAKYAVDVLGTTERVEIAVPDGFSSDPGVSYVKYVNVASTATAITESSQVLVTRWGNTAAAGPQVGLMRESISPASNDFLGSYSYSGRNDVADMVNYAQHRVRLDNPANGAEGGSLQTFCISSGSLTEAYTASEGGLDETFMIIRANRNGVVNMRRVKVGATDSGGAGFRALVIDN